MDLCGEAEAYPSLTGRGVAGYYAERFGVGPRQFLSGNGSTEMIYLIPRVLRLGRAAVITPSYDDYERACLLAGTAVVRFPLDRENGFSAPGMDRLAAILREVDGLWLGRPNNPSATLIPKAHILELAGRFPEKCFIVDEAFIQFLDDWREQSLLFERPLPNVLVVHSLTKFYAVAGLRLGGVFAAEGVIDRLERAKEPWTVNGIADRLAPMLGRCAEYEERSRGMVRAEIGRFRSWIEPLEGIAAYPSRINFLLCRWTRTRDLDDLLRHLLERGVYVRDCRNFPGLEAGYFRIGLRGPGDNDRLMGCLASACDQCP